MCVLLVLRSDLLFEISLRYINSLFIFRQKSQYDAWEFWVIRNFNGTESHWFKIYKKVQFGKPYTYCLPQRLRKNINIYKKFQMQWPSRKILFRDCLHKSLFLNFFEWKVPKKDQNGKEGNSFQNVNFDLWTILNRTTTKSYIL